MNLKLQITLMLVSSLISFYFGLLCNNFSDFGPIHWIVTILIFLFVITLLASMGPLRLILKSSGSCKLTDEWESEWSFYKDGALVEVSDRISLHQIGRYVHGSGQSYSIKGPVKFKIAEYKIRAEIFSDGHIEGVWINKNEGRYYRGTFLGRIHNSSTEIIAKWVGIGTDEIHTGNWEWKREYNEV